eukprot:8213772-Alexandrium_andersonii.AAC.1
MLRTTSLLNDSSSRLQANFTFPTTALCFPTWGSMWNFGRKCASASRAWMPTSFKGARTRVAPLGS